MTTPVTRFSDKFQTFWSVSILYKHSEYTKSNSMPVG